MNAADNQQPAWLKSISFDEWESRIRTSPDNFGYGDTGERTYRKPDTRQQIATRRQFEQRMAEARASLKERGIIS